LEAPLIYSPRVHWQFIKMRIAARMAYRVDFVASLGIFTLLQMVGPLFIATIYHAGAQFPGWSLDEALLLQGILISVKGFSFMFFFELFRRTALYVRRGTFDMYLLRPISCLSLLVMDAFDEEDIGPVLGGALLIGYSVFRLGAPRGYVLPALALGFFGVLFFFSLTVFFAAITIRLVNTLRLTELIEISMLFASYPRTIFPQFLGTVFTLFFPLFILSSLPAAALLGKSFTGSGLACLAVLVFLALSLLAWRASLARYASAGG
jgi:ABC-2 type transport system permease protein